MKTFLYLWGAWMDRCVVFVEHPSSSLRLMPLVHLGAWVCKLTCTVTASDEHGGFREGEEQDGLGFLLIVTVQLDVCCACSNHQHFVCIIHSMMLWKSAAGDMGVSVCIL